MTSAPLNEAQFLSILDRLSPAQIRKLAVLCSGEAAGGLPDLAAPLLSLADGKDWEQEQSEAA
ncbi:hypothetical protein PANO111632_05615 [Paracoccus nototheniae]|uniref:Uncharacterized protein n=1 Tax=Paracoccus nototheniae TaxID=2489002 RepID=A0ABW4E1L0_9RHOB|nr:hypothetical protein [Paracoccus nototheniae]